ncbi:MAG: ABC transporter permease subunit [Nitriliruptorales bacterium]|nr:ABC transporter permease subunit [Nitriliruptorales bacterium]
MSVAIRPAATSSEAVLRRTAEAHRRGVRRERLTVQAGIVTLGVGILLFWEFGIGLLVNPRYVSAPSAIAIRLAETLSEGTLLRHTQVTMLEAGAGYLIGVIVGLVGSFLLAFTRRGYEVLEPYLIWFYSIPKIALAPLFIMWFGLGLAPKVLLAALMVFFIVFMNTVAGVRAISPGLLEVSRIFGASKFALVGKVMFPAASPAIMAGIRVTFTRAMVGAILAEFIASTEGLGFMIVRASRQFDIATVFAGILVIAVVVMTVNAVIRAIESRLLPWHSAEVHG